MMDTVMALNSHYLQYTEEGAVPNKVKKVAKPTQSHKNL